MISLGVRIRNPWHNEEKNPWRSICQKAWPITRHKTLEIITSHYLYNLFELYIDLNCVGSDHAGPTLNLSILGWEFYIGLLDNRHWDYKNNCWEDHENSNG